MKITLSKKNRLKFLLLICAFIPILGFSQTGKTITGVVKDANGLGLPGVNVQVEGTDVGAATNWEGEFSIEAESGDVLVFSFIGLKTKKITVGSDTVLDVQMEEDSGALEEVVIVGFGVQKKESVVGAISQVSGETLQKVKMGGSLENSLQGNLPGLTVVSTDPTPGEEAIGGLSMVIRGTSSMGSNGPLYIVDGVERPISNIDPNDIASISILKDASATAVYGVKGANGVVIVNTKRGASGALQLNFNSQLSIKTPTELPEYMNAYETMLLRNEAYRNDGMWNNLISDEELAHYRDQDLPYLYPDFDWMDYYFKPGFDQNYNLNARGGTDFVKYFVSVGYLEEGDVFDVGNVFPYDYDERNAHYWHQRYNFRNNLDFTLTESTQLTLNVGGNLKVWNKPIDDYTQENWYQSVTAMPYYPADALNAYPDGLIPYNQSGIRPYINPDMGEVRLNWQGGQGFQRLKSNELNVDIKFNQELDFITKGLSANILYSYNTLQQYRKYYRLPLYFGYFLNPQTQEWSRYDNWGTEDLDTPQPPLNISETENISDAYRSHFYQGQLNYNRSFGKHNFGLTGVFTRRESRAISDFTHYEENWIGRGTYNYDQRYFLEASITHSGSEKFAPGLRFGTFPAFAGGWTISNESFYKDSKASTFMDFVKLRGSYGVVGSDAGIDRWLYISEFTDGDQTIGFGNPIQYYPVINEGNIPVTDATWEEATKSNVAVDLGFFDSAVTLSVDLFDERRTGVLQSRQSVPSYIGVSGISGNLGETKSHGMEVQLGFNKAINDNWVVYGSANIAWSENRVVYYDEPASRPFHLKAEGKPVEIARRLGWYTPGTGVMDNGFYQNFDQLFMYPRASGGSPIVGDLAFMDFNGDGVVDQQDRIVSEYPIVPELNWNASLGANFKNWSLDVQLYGIGKTQQPMRQGGMFFLYPFTEGKNNAFTAHGNHWTPTNTNAEFPSVHNVAIDQYNYRISQFSMIDGQYIRLRNVRLGYTLKSDFLDKLSIKNVNFGLTGTNLLTWSRRGWGGDPEGFNFGADFGAYPQMKRYSFDLSIEF
ncbi:SusC/RagA family TonB-linked outer membrane protein [Zunongwangia atlantica]|uniref:TonB-dependent Receptor n=1 Tax=Zunongwangia atlantica 22II14-10F7 TaxID=1185767 RepID=A0A1Y1SYN5_9FLAO|nr:TonB-dependent receptor [Zunongwangia atlantica]ORL43869.1 TonB-dependent Receptor [Zunongwangia atlantica 22II14-10F7]